MSRDQNSCRQKVNNFLSVFGGTDEGNVTWYLAVQVSTSGSMMTLSQPAYIDDILNVYNLQDAKPAAAPMQHNFYDELEVHKNEPVLRDDRYRNMIGSLLFLANRTRPEIGTSVGILSHYSSKPTEFLLQL